MLALKIMLFRQLLVGDKYIYCGSCRYQSPFLNKFAAWNFMINQISVGIHIRHTAVANFYIGPSKKSR